MGPDDSEITPGEMRRWLARLEANSTRLEGKIDALDHDMRQLTFVSQREYEKDRVADHAYAEETRAIATSARAFIWAMFALIAVAVIGSGYAILRSVG
jgi:hypothetical protein